MNSLFSLLGQLGDLLLVILGFSLIIVIHEMGHFLAARWAKIRVLAFAAGFGPALLSFRPGLGWRRGSSEPHYKKLIETGAAGPDISPTEYRLNTLPFGGYVKMLGQDDLDPTARSSEPDSYQRSKPWKRLIVISAGVIANLITAAILFVVVFMLGLRTEPAKVGMVEPGSPAATTIADNAAQFGITTPGLKGGDEVISINGEKALSFPDVMLASMMARPGSLVQIDVRRPGVSGVLQFPIKPVLDPGTKMLHIGIGPAASATLLTSKLPEARARFNDILSKRGLTGVEAGMKLQSLDGRPVAAAYDLLDAAERSEGRPLRAVFQGGGGRTFTTDIPVRPRMMRDQFMVDPTEAREARHLLGVMPVLAVDEVPPGEAGEKAGLRPGDVFARIGSVEWPSVPAGVAEVRSNRGRTVQIVVARAGPNAQWSEIDLGQVKVSSAGTIGFSLGDSSARGPWVGTAYPKSDSTLTPPRLAPGSRIVAVDGRVTASLLEVRQQLRRSVSTPGPSAPVKLTIERPLATADGTPSMDEVDWQLSPEAARTLTAAAWEPVLDPADFELEQFDLKAAGPLGAIGMGLRETKRVMLTTYVTFARLFQGSIKVVHLKGPVGIADVGTKLAKRGPVWLLFFMALISVNLAVINFLPLPIVDGGLFLFVLYEMATGKPISAAVQNIASIAGLIVIATLFLVVTFNDISNLFRG